MPEMFHCCCSHCPLCSGEQMQDGKDGYAIKHKYTKALYHTKNMTHETMAMLNWCKEEWFAALTVLLLPWERYSGLGSLKFGTSE